MIDMTPEKAKQVSGSPMFAAMRELSDGGTYKRLDAYFMAAYWWEVWDALLASQSRIEALEKARMLAISEWSTWKDVLVSNMTEADWRETMDGLRAPSALAEED